MHTRERLPSNIIYLLEPWKKSISVVVDVVVAGLLLLSEISILMYSMWCFMALFALLRVVSAHLQALSDVQYEIIFKMAQTGTCGVPVAERTSEQKCAVVKFHRYRRKGLPFTVEGDKLMLDNKPVARKREVEKIVTDIFKDNKSGGYKKIYHRAQNGHAGLTQISK